MSFKPAGQTNSESFEDNGPKIDFNAVNAQVKGGSRPARVSLIVDLGVQEREEFSEDYDANKAKHKKALEDKTGYLPALMEGQAQQINITQKDQPQIAVFADLVNDVVDYGEVIGKKPYRLMVNGSFGGKLQGIGFAGCYSFDKNGEILKDKGFTFHAQNKLTKLAKATGQTQIISGSGNDNMDVSQLLGQKFMAQVDKTEKDDGAKVYLNYKSCSETPMVPDAEGNEVPYPVKELVGEAKCITFDNMTEEDKIFLRGNIIKTIKMAKNYQGSQMQKVLDAGKPEQADVAPANFDKPATSTPASTGVNEPDFDDEEETPPF